MTYDLSRFLQPVHGESAQRSIRKACFTRIGKSPNQDSVDCSSRLTPINRGRPLVHFIMRSLATRWWATRWTPGCAGLNPGFSGIRFTQLMYVPRYIWPSCLPATHDSNPCNIGTWCSANTMMTCSNAIGIWYLLCDMASAIQAAVTDTSEQGMRGQHMCSASATQMQCVRLHANKITLSERHHDTE